MKTGNKVPAIRFKGFNGAWEEKKIGNILTEVKRPIELNDNTFYQLVTVKRRNGGVVPRALLKGRDILVKTYFVINKGDYLISKRQVVHGANGIVPKNLDNAVVSNEYLVVTDNENITTNFWTVISKRTEMHKMFFISSYGVDIEKLVFDVNDWKQRIIKIPKLTEQNRITGYFQQLDKLITLHQKKHEKLLNLKKSLFEKVFPKQGTKEPEIRFKGFSGEWMGMMLGDVAKITMGQSPNGDNYTDNPEDHILVQGNADMKNGFVKPRVWTSQVTKTANAGDLIFSVRAPVGEVGKTAYNLVIGRGVAAIKANEFIFQFLCKKNSDGYWKKLSAGSTFDSINSSDLFTAVIQQPSDDEQTKIGIFFEKIDSLLNQHQAQLKKLNNIKQACLEKMFV